MKQQTLIAAGDVVHDGLNQYAYDGEGRLCAVYSSLGGTLTGYAYDAEGRRVAKGTLGEPTPSQNNPFIASTYCNLAGTSSFTPTAEYLLDPGGDQVTELNGSGVWQHTNIFAAGTLDATYDTSGLHFHLSDWLGTRRVQASAQGAWEAEFQSLPFGDGPNKYFSNLSTADDATEHHFTGKERDAESGLDYFGARYYASSMGRFLSPDFTDDFLLPAPVPWADYTNPQSLNLYAYVRNNPLSQTDDLGHDVQICDNDGHCHTVTNDEYKAAQQAQNQGGLNAPTLDQVGNSKDANGNFTSVAITSTDANGNTTQVGTATYVPSENPGIDPYVGNNMAGLRTIATAGATVGSVRGVATFYGASLAAATCVVGCAAAATVIPEAANSATLQLMAYLESQGIPATAAAAMAAKMLSQFGTKPTGAAIKFYAQQLNQLVREYHQSMSQATGSFATQ